MYFYSCCHSNLEDKQTASSYRCPHAGQSRMPTSEKKQLLATLQILGAQQPRSWWSGRRRTWRRCRRSSRRWRTSGRTATSVSGSAEQPWRCGRPRCRWTGSTMPLRSATRSGSWFRSETFLKKCGSLRLFLKITSYFLFCGFAFSFLFSADFEAREREREREREYRLLSRSWHPK